jgi:hypothetical protein
MQSVTLNAEQRLFVLKSGHGFSCLGFDVAFSRLAQYAELLGRPAPSKTDVGTAKQYEQYREMERDYIATNPKDTFFEAETPLVLRHVLESVRVLGTSIRVFFGDPLTGRDWLNEYDVLGKVGRSTGHIRIPLLVSAGATGGGALMTSQILRVLDVKTKGELYRHPLYQTVLTKPVQTCSSPRKALQQA